MWLAPVAVKPPPAQPAVRNATTPARSARRVDTLHPAAAAGLDPVRRIDGDAIGRARGLRAHLEVVAGAEHDVLVHGGDLARDGLARGIERLHEEADPRCSLAGGVQVRIALHDGPAAPI